AAHDPAVDAHRAGAADAVLAAGARPHQPQVEAQEVDEMAARLNAARHPLAIDRKGDVEGRAHAARASSTPQSRRRARPRSTRALPSRSPGGSGACPPPPGPRPLASPAPGRPATPAAAAGAMVGPPPPPNRTTLVSASTLPSSWAPPPTPAMA